MEEVSDVLSLKERIDLAVCIFGMYTFGSGPDWTPFDGIPYKEACAAWAIDIAFACTAVGVPKLRSECDERMLSKLAELVKAQPPWMYLLGELKPTGTVDAAKLLALVKANPNANWATAFVPDDTKKQGE